MSLTSFLRLPEVTTRVKPLLPKLPRKIGAPLKAPPLTSHYSLVGTAFDYLFRFEARRRAPGAIEERSVAEHTPEIFYRRVTLPGGRISVEGSQLDNRTLGLLTPGQVCHPLTAAREAAARAQRVLDQARSAIDAFTARKSVTRAALEEAARHARRLAKLDPVFRAGRLAPDVFGEPDPRDIQDLLTLLALVPFEALLDSQTILLNPNFKDLSLLIGGADADLLVGDMLVDFKTTKNDTMNGFYLDQLLGYLVLARTQRRLDPSFPAVHRLALYFSRHAYLWALPTVTWTDLPEFPEFEVWFISRAESVFSLPPEAAEFVPAKTNLQSRQRPPRKPG